ncbi:MAG TPA: hypothetical protein VMT35_04680 [Ignavibacteriaceae bacterium]|nr:hypothetical protein [Ignavibacteriaceae bacterium]
MKIILSLFFFSLVFFGISGCLVFHKISYEINLDNSTAALFISDIRSDASDASAFTEDKAQLFEYYQKSTAFLDSLKKGGRNIISRELFKDNDTLNAKVIYLFNDISKVEGIAFEEGFNFLTLPPDDSILSTNGQVVRSADYKRILWDESIKVLKFEMLGNTFEGGEFRSLAPYYKPEE